MCRGESSSTSPATAVLAQGKMRSRIFTGPAWSISRPIWILFLLLCALVVATMGQGGSHGLSHDSARDMNTPADVAPSPDSTLTVSSAPGSPITTGGISGPSGGFRILETLLGSKGSHVNIEEGAPSTSRADGSVESYQAGGRVVVDSGTHPPESEISEQGQGAGLPPVIAANVREALPPASIEEGPVQELPKEQKQGHAQPEQKVGLTNPSHSKAKGPQAEVNYAAEKAGAVVLQSSHSLVGAKNLLDDDKDKYARSPCDQSKWLIINLSEDIRIDSLVLANYEKFSSMVKDFQVLYSVKCPSLDGDEDSDGWMELGTFQAKEKAGEQRFQVDPPRYARYLKVRLLSHWSREFYCTLSQIKVLGSTLQQGFMDDWQRQKINLGSHLEAIGPSDAIGSHNEVEGGGDGGSVNQTCLVDGDCPAPEGEETPFMPADNVEGDLSTIDTSTAEDDRGAHSNTPPASKAPKPSKANPGNERVQEDLQQTRSATVENGMPGTEREGVVQHDDLDRNLNGTGSDDDIQRINSSLPFGRDEALKGGASGDDCTGEKMSEHFPAKEPTNELLRKDLPSRKPSHEDGEILVENGGTAVAGGKAIPSSGNLHAENSEEQGVARPPSSADLPLPLDAPKVHDTTAKYSGQSQDLEALHPTASSAAEPEGEDIAKARESENGVTAEAEFYETSASGGKPLVSPTRDSNGDGVVTPIPHMGPGSHAKPPTQVHDGGSPQYTAASTTSTTTVLATVSGAPAKTELMTRFRHQCLQQMRLSDFKKQKLAKLQDDPRTKDHGTGSTATSLGSGSPYDNIFKTLMDEMASLEINQSIFDVYVSNLHSCFVQVVDDVLLEQDRARLEALETIGLLQARLQSQAAVNEQFLRRMQRLESMSLAGGLAWIALIACLILAAGAQRTLWKRWQGIATIEQPEM